jgi:hypothetical protein
MQLRLVVEVERAPDLADGLRLQLLSTRSRQGGAEPFRIRRGTQQVCRLHQTLELVRGNERNVLRTATLDHHGFASFSHGVTQRRKVRPSIRIGR